MRCPRCGVESQQGKRFCADCGAALAATVPEGTGSNSRVTFDTLAPREQIHGERRHITVLFSDLVNSTRLAAERDPEEWRDIATEYLTATGQAILSLGGYVARYMGDGVLAYFGWPTASEDDGERAVRAGLAIVEAVAVLNRHYAARAGVQLSVRVGIDSGLVVVDEVSGKAEVFGDAPNIASRVQARCAPNCVLMTGAVHDLVAGRFIVDDCGAHQLAGIERPIRLYRAVVSSGIRRHWRRGAVGRSTPFVDRKRELDVLRHSLRSTCKGAGQCVFVTGEPGIGKSRLVEEFRSQIKDPHLWIECAGERFFESTPFHVITKLLEQGFRWHGEESAEQRWSQLESALKLSGVDLADALPLMAEMLKLPPSTKYPAPQIGPEQARNQLLASLVAWALKLARLQPLIIVVDDLHWVDPSSRELARMLVEQATDVPLMLIAAARPEFRPPWEMSTNCKSIMVGRLSDDHIGQMISSASGLDGLSCDVVDSVVKRSDGVPIFAEELLSFVLDRKGSPTVQDIPSTLLDSLTARLDRLGPARKIAQVAAVLGREFTYALLRAVAPGSDEEVQSALTALTEADLIRRRGKPPRATYQFKHALIRDAAYEGLLKSERRDLHGRVARTICEAFPALAEAQPVLLARHWTEAGEPDPAIAAWKGAGDKAYARWAFREAEEDYRQASAMMKQLPESSERDRRELALCSALVRVLQLTKGYSAPETMHLGARARALAEQLGDLSQLIRQGARTWAAIFVTGDYAAATALAEQILELALIQGENTEYLVFAHNAQVQTRYYTGDLAGVEDHFARLSPLINTSRSRTAPGDNIIPIGIASLAAWHLGRAETARERISRAVDLATDSQDPYDTAMALHFKGNLYWCLRAPRRAKAAASRLLSLSEAHGFRYASDLARVLLGWAKSELGGVAEGVEMIRQGLAGLASAGAKVAITYFLTILAEAQVRNGDVELGLRFLGEALAANPQELICRPQTLRCRGELRLKMGHADMAEADFRSAIEMARTMGHKASQLRAAMSLARLLEKHGDRLAAREILAPIYSSFREGFRTADLLEAKSLLARMR
jgi:class 3 adenylate cyclase/tetratricopeptide (TPR) repeat protein